MATLTEMNQVNTLLVTNKYLLADIRSQRLNLEALTQSFVDRQIKSIPANTRGINAALLEIDLINKKIQDNHSSASNILSQVRLDDEYFKLTSNSFLRSATVSDSAQPAEAIVGATLAFDIYIVNKGMYYSWSEDKAVTLTLSLYSSAGDLVQIYDYQLDTTLNPPGGEKTNGDYGAIKNWQITGLVMPMMPDTGMSIHYSLSDTYGGVTNTYNFNYSATIDLFAA